MLCNEFENSRVDVDMDFSMLTGTEEPWTNGHDLLMLLNTECSEILCFPHLLFLFKPELLDS